MKGKTILITGATSGIGKYTAIDLAQKGAKIVFNTRDTQRGEEARKDIIQQSGNEDVHVLPCDLASLDQVRKFAADFRSKFDRLDILINNAGVLMTKRVLTDDGFETTFAVNQLAPFLLTLSLLDMLKANAPSRIINLSSVIHTRGKMDFDDLHAANRKYSGMGAYGDSKLAILLFTRDLAKRLEGTGVSVNALHPGLVGTSIARSMGPIFGGLFKLLGKSSEKGAATTIYLAESDEGANVSGEYFENSKIQKSSSDSKNMEDAARLWQLCEEMCDIVYK